MRLSVPATLVTLLLAAGCSASSPTEPAPQIPVQLEARITQATIGPGETAILTFTLRNVTGRQVALDFGSGCFLLPSIVRAGTQDLVYPRDGGWVCVLIVGQLVLPPGGTYTQDLVVRGAEVTTQSAVLLPPGEYEAFARLNDTALGVRSAPVRFTVQ